MIRSRLDRLGPLVAKLILLAGIVALATWAGVIRGGYVAG